MTKTRLRVYWDCAPLIAWLTDEKRANPEDMRGVERVMKAFKNGDVLIVTSVFSFLEMLPSKLGDEAMAKLVALRARPDLFPELEMTGKIVELAREVRWKADAAGIRITSQDAIHIATAMAWRVDYLHTFDGTGTCRKKAKMIPLSGMDIVEGLKICVPDYETPGDPRLLKIPF